MSNRKQAHRRRAYGRRQHEIHERRERQPWSVDWTVASDPEASTEPSHEAARVELGAPGASGPGGGFGSAHPDLRWEQNA